MDKNYELKYHDLEKNHWWFKGRRDMILKLLLDTDKNAKILDVGCSGGVLIEYLLEKGYFNIFGIDISRRAINTCKNKNLKNVFVKDGSKTNFKKNEFDVIIASDILEHIQKDKLALKEWYRIIKPGGFIIIFVPAFQFLWDKHDEVNDHFRRYSKKDLINKINNCGFLIKRYSYWNFSLFFIRSLQKVFVKDKDQLQYVSSNLNKFLTSLLKFENWFLNKINFPVGLSIFIVARKK